MAWFAKSQTALPRPFRLLSPDHGVAEDSSSSAASSGRKRKERGVYGPPAATTLNRLRSDRMWFKNVRIHFTEWPWDLDVSPSEEKTLVRKRARVEEDSLGCRDVPEPSAPDFRGALQGQKGPTVSNHAGRGETEHDREVFVRSFVEALQVILRDLFMMDSKSELSDSTNLFELGMDSITAMCIISRLRQHGIVASVQMLLRNPVVGKLKELIERG
jgi:aryl carrier-like protein